MWSVAIPPVTAANRFQLASIVSAISKPKPERYIGSCVIIRSLAFQSVYTGNHEFIIYILRHHHPIIVPTPRALISFPYGLHI
jgi:hypothetical protein